MRKFAPGITATVIMVLIAVLLYMMWDWQVRAFWPVSLVFAAIGFVSVAYAVYRFLAWAMVSVPDVPVIGRSVEEDDAAAWEQM